MLPPFLPLVLGFHGQQSQRRLSDVRLRRWVFVFGYRCLFEGFLDGCIVGAGPYFVVDFPTNEINWYHCRRLTIEGRLALRVLIRVVQS